MSEAYRNDRPEEETPDREEEEWIIDLDDFYDLLMEQQEQM